LSRRLVVFASAAVVAMSLDGLNVAVARY